MVYRYKTKGTCSSAIIIDLADDDTINSVEFYGGCNGNAKGNAALVKGMKAQEVIAKLSGIKCGFKNTSCPDQLATALTMILKDRKNS